MENLGISALKWIAPHGIARSVARARQRRENEKQIERQHALFNPFVPPGSVVFDVGANVGNRVTALLSCGARVVAIEPQPECVAHMKRAYGNRITVVQAAVGSSPGKLPLHLNSPMDTLATLSNDFIAYAQESRRFGAPKWANTIEVEVTTLDSLISQFGRPSFIKVDVEGYEANVLAGLSQGVDVLSFEWTANMPANALRCIDHLVSLGMDQFHFSFGESMLFAHRESLRVDDARKLVELLGDEPELWGDIYASRRRLKR